MAILSDRPWNTEKWVGTERMHDPPDWHGVSPEIVAKRGKPWSQDYTDGPWLDQNGALDKIQRRLGEGAISDEEAELLRRWVVDGYFVLREAIEKPDFGLLDRYQKDLNELWTTDTELPGLQVMSLHIPGRLPGPVDHAEILSWPMEKRVYLRDSQLWRIHYYHPHTAAGLALTKAPRLLRMCSLLLDEDPVLINSIGFKYGSQVGLHQDICAYHIHPANRLIGIWLAAEDVNAAAGPLGVFPGTHKAGMWKGWKNYPQTSLRTCHLDTRDAQAEFLAEVVEGVPRKPLVVNKGDAIFQHPLLTHGGDKIQDRAASRFSLVLHYSVEGGDKMHEMEGPFNW
ncbi:MAG: phytanoyl-CoA dioxygenase family protein [Myxococcales bacterium]|nr:phytanoyl-CoA dioxygenase family protein [Myxococcales bacterium]